MAAQSHLKLNAAQMSFMPDISTPRQEKS